MICVVIFCLAVCLFLFVNIADQIQAKKTIEKLDADVAGLRKKLSSRSEDFCSSYYTEFNNLKKFVSNNITTIKNSVNANSLDVKILEEAMNEVANRLDKHDEILSKKDKDDKYIKS